jgi:nitrogen regulatory protein PII
VLSAGTLDDLTEALAAVGIQGFTAGVVRAYGAAPGRSVYYRGTRYSMEGAPKLKVEIVVADQECARVLATLETLATRGRIGDEDLLLLPCEASVRIRTGELSGAAL